MGEKAKKKEEEKGDRVERVKVKRWQKERSKEVNNGLKDKLKEICTLKIIDV